VVSSVEQITGKKILVTGVTGWVAGPLAESLAAQGNTVYGAARFKDPDQRQPWHDKGVQTVSIDLAKGNLDEVPADLDLVLHFAVAKSNNFEEAFASNAHGSADLMEVAAARSDKLSFFHCSSTAVYEPKHGEARKETDLLGDSHRPMPGMPTYSIFKDRRRSFGEAHRKATRRSDGDRSTECSVRRCIWLDVIPPHDDGTQYPCAGSRRSTNDIHPNSR